MTLLYRLLLPIVAAVALGFLVLDFMMVRSIDHNYSELAVNDAMESLTAAAEDIKGWVDVSVQASQTLAQSLSFLAANPEAFNENAVMDLLMSLQRNNSELFYGVWANWLPGQFPENVSSTYMSEGHFAPMAFPASGGGISKVTTTGHASGGEKSLWFTQPIDTGKTYITEPTTYFIDGRDVTLLTIGFPIKLNDRIIGVAGVNMDVSFVREAISKLNFMGAGYAMLITNKFNYFAHPDKDLWGKDAKGDFPQVFQQRYNEEGVVFSRLDERTNADSQFVFKGIKFMDTDDQIVLGMAIPEKDIFAFLHNLTIQSIVIGLISIAAICGIVYYIIKGLVNKIGGEPEAVIDTIKRVAQGDLTKVGNQTSNDDSLAGQVNTMTHSLRTLIGKFDENAKQMTGTSDFLSTASSDLTNNTDKQSKGAEQVAAASVQMTQTIQEIANNLVDMSDFARETGSKAGEGTRAVEALTEGVMSIQRTADESSQSVNALLNSSEKIRDIVDVISGIAEQTNLLALNAAIEAARAGEQGRGFAVVADEVRGLAGRTQKATFEISELVNSTQADVESVTKSMEGVGQQVNNGVELTSQVSESLGMIVEGVDSLESRLSGVSSATTEMASASEEVEQNINNMANLSRGVNEIATKISDQANALNTMSAEVQDSVQHFRL